MSRTARRRGFDSQIARAVARWEILRRTPGYRGTVDAWLGSGGRSEDGIVLTDPWDHRTRKRYEADCASFGLRLLLHYDTEVGEGDMVRYPVFADTPRQQRRPKHEITRDRARQAPSDQRPALEKLAAKQKQKYKAWLKSHIDLSDRSRQRHIGTEEVPSGPWQGPGKWAHLDNLRWYLKVYDLRKQSTPFRRVAKQLKVSVYQAKRAWRVAFELVEAGIEVSWARIENHLNQCDRCRMSQKEMISDRWCPIGRRLARRAGLLLPGLRESVRQGVDAGALAPDEWEPAVLGAAAEDDPAQE